MSRTEQRLLGVLALSGSRSDRSEPMIICPGSEYEFVEAGLVKLYDELAGSASGRLEPVLAWQHPPHLMNVDLRGCSHLLADYL